MVTSDPKEERDLLDKLQDGEHTAFAVVFHGLYQDMYQFALKCSTDPYVAEDIIEDTFLHLLEDRPVFNDLKHLKAYLFRNIRYKYMDHAKAGKRAVAREAAYTAGQDFEETTYLAQIMRTEIMLGLRQAIHELPLQVRKIITMTYLEGMSNQEAADELNLSVQTIKNQKRRGLDLLKNRLPQDRYRLLLMLFVYHSAQLITS